MSVGFLKPGCQLISLSLSPLRAACDVCPLRSKRGGSEARFSDRHNQTDAALAQSCVSGHFSCIRLLFTSIWLSALAILEERGLPDGSWDPLRAWVKEQRDQGDLHLILSVMYLLPVPPAVEQAVSWSGCVGQAGLPPDRPPTSAPRSSYTRIRSPPGLHTHTQIHISYSNYWQKWRLWIAISAYSRIPLNTDCWATQEQVLRQDQDGTWIMHVTVCMFMVLFRGTNQLVKVARPTETCFRMMFYSWTDIPALEYPPQPCYD